MSALGMILLSACSPRNSTAGQPLYRYVPASAVFAAGMHRRAARHLPGHTATLLKRLGIRTPPTHSGHAMANELSNWLFGPWPLFPVLDRIDAEREIAEFVAYVTARGATLRLRPTSSKRFLALLRTRYGAGSLDTAGAPSWALKFHRRTWQIRMLGDQIIVQSLQPPAAADGREQFPGPAATQTAPWLPEGAVDFIHREATPAATTGHQDHAAGACQALARSLYLAASRYVLDTAIDRHGNRRGRLQATLPAPGPDWLDSVIDAAPRLETDTRNGIRLALGLHVGPLLTGEKRAAQCALDALERFQLTPELLTPLPAYLSAVHGMALNIIPRQADRGPPGIQALLRLRDPKAALTTLTLAFPEANVIGGPPRLPRRIDDASTEITLAVSAGELKLGFHAPIPQRRPDTTNARQGITFMTAAASGSAWNKLLMGDAAQGQLSGAQWLSSAQQWQAELSFMDPTVVLSWSLSEKRPTINRQLASTGTAAGEIGKKAAH